MYSCSSLTASSAADNARISFSIGAVCPSCRISSVEGAGDGRLRCTSLRLSALAGLMTLTAVHVEAGSISAAACAIVRTSLSCRPPSTFRSCDVRQALLDGPHEKQN